VAVAGVTLITLTLYLFVGEAMLTQHPKKEKK
jgi:hypothetical protein